MNKRFFWMAFALGLAAVAWVAAGFAGTHWTAFAMTLVIGATYLGGAYELHRHRADSAALAAALADETPPSGLAAWLERVPASLRPAVRHRIEEGRGALPGPALTPYLVGLLVMLGMLGTFLGMVVTFKGAVFALEGSTDLQAIRAALAEPIRGLGLSFGASVAGVAASAMLGLMSAISRRERIAVARLLDARTAGPLRPFSLAHQREETLRAAQAQTAVLPAVVDKLEALMARIESRGEEIDRRLLDAQSQFHQNAAGAYTGLAQQVGASLERSLAAGAQAAGESIRPVMEAAITRIAEDQARSEAARLAAWSGELHAMTAKLEAQWQRTAERADAQAARTLDEISKLLSQTRTELGALRDEESRRGDAAVARLGELQGAVAQHLATLGAALEAPLARLLATASEVPQAAAGVLAQLRAEMARLSEQENVALQERSVLVERLGRLVDTVEEASRQAGEMAAQAGASAIELSSWGEAFGQGVQRFHDSNEKLVAAMQQVEGAIGRSTARSDEQLAYYVAQAREVIDLSIASQHGVIEKLRELAAKPKASA
jgi:DNA-binding ferritin-like protein